MKKGFTLIELLVVVLIIGVLAAIALPQYQKAVTKARITEMISMVNTLEKAGDLYLLQHNLPPENTPTVILTSSFVENYYPHLSAVTSRNTTKYCSPSKICVSVSGSSDGLTILVDNFQRQGLGNVADAPDFCLTSERTYTRSWDRRYSSYSVDVSKFGLEQFGYSKPS